MIIEDRLLSREKSFFLRVLYIISMDVEAMEKRFLKINRMFGVLTSVWPYQRPFPRLIQRIIALTILFTSFVTQVSVFS